MLRIYHKSVRLGILFPFLTVCSWAIEVGLVGLLIFTTQGVFQEHNYGKISLLLWARIIKHTSLFPIPLNIHFNSMLLCT